MLHQRGLVVWLLGLSGAGKSTLSGLLEAELDKLGYTTVALDGDEVRSGLNRDLGFSAADREENIRRAAEMAKILIQKQIVVICSFITPSEISRKQNREILGQRYLEVYLDCSLQVCENRDVKGLYQKARNHKIMNFTGIGSKFDIPKDSDLVLNTAVESQQASFKVLLEKVLEKMG
tara:strand:- start:501 stop:1031 length:531 start_codon:yes stop_codon:yes gene_type:complete